jgi:hypothetical protein
MPLLSRRAARLERGAESANISREAQIERAAEVPARWPGHVSAGARTGIFSMCANPGCRSGWLQLWRRRETPVFEGGWSCSEACTMARIESALAREMDGRGSAVEHHRHRIPLGLAMLEQGWITQEDLRRALLAQKSAGTGKLGWWLVRQQCASEELVARALGLQWGCPVLGLEFHRPEGLTALVPRLFVDAFGALPLRVAAGRILYLGFEDRLDPALALAVERVSELRVESGLVEESQFRPAHTRMLEAEFPQAELLEAATEPALAAEFTQAVERLRPVEARLARVHDCLWLRMWLSPQNGALPELDSVRDLIGSARAH